MERARSLLLLPADDQRLISQAATTTADAVVLDLTNVAGDVEGARKRLRGPIETLSAARRSVFVRLSPFEAGLAAAELSAAVGQGLHGLILARTQGPRDIRQLDVLLRERELHSQVRPGTVALIPQIDTAAGLLRCEQIVQAS